MELTKSYLVLTSCLPTTTACSTSLRPRQRYDSLNSGQKYADISLKDGREDEKFVALYKTRNDFVKGRSNIESLLPYSRPSPTHESWAEYFRKELEALITEKAIRHAGDNSRYVDIVGDVINLLPVRWVSEKIVSASRLS
jgi:hypothetical protein